jgi:hypothetical protein
MTTPKLSVIVLTDRFATIQRVVDHLSAQTIAGDIELVIGCPVRDELQMPTDVTFSLARVTVIEVPLLPAGTARATAVRAASAPVVVIGETHAFPAPEWASLLVHAHLGSWGSVAPGMVNANPETARSWAAFLMDYGRWLAVRPKGQIAEPPAYNASWKLAALLSVGERLPAMLDPAGALDSALAKEGRFHHEPRAHVEHLNVVSPKAWMVERYCGGRLLGAHRRRRWPLWRRVIYAGGSWLIPIVLLLRSRQALTLARRTTRIPRGTFPILVAASLLWALGEGLGYLAGPGQAEARMMEYEVNKEKYA